MWELQKIVIVVLSIMVLGMLILFSTEFREILEIDKELQNRKDAAMYEDLKRSSPSTFLLTGVIQMKLKENPEVKNGM